MKIKDLPLLEQTFRQHSNPQVAAPMAKYMLDQFPFLGIKTPDRRELYKTFVAQHGHPDCKDVPAIVKKLWQMPEREFHHIALDMAIRCSKKFEEKDLELFEYMTLENSWWDTVDMVATKLFAQYFQKFPHKRDEKIKEYLNSGNLWLQRVSIIFQIKYKAQTDEELLFGNILQSMDHKDFFIRKAIGWALREYGSTNPEAVVQFVAANENELSGLSKKEALRNILKK